MTTWGESVHAAGRCAVDNEDCQGPLEAHHLIPRSHKLFRDDSQNGLSLCWQHHHGSRLSPHGAPAAFREWLKTHLPDKYNFMQENKWHTKTL